MQMNLQPLSEDLAVNFTSMWSLLNCAPRRPECSRSDAPRKTPSPMPQNVPEGISVSSWAGSGHAVDGSWASGSAALSGPGPVSVSGSHTNWKKVSNSENADGAGIVTV